ncbi:hypothetical protein EIP86_009199 [Pleurotus ostreatoroseus]|nr:hypothetical protein EIP86_009199 [Pleurotus ostreatoroseus]
MVDITNDGQQSSTDPEMLLNATTARITGRYRAFTCVDFKGEGFDLVSASAAPQSGLNGFEM